MPWREVSVMDQRREFVGLAMQEGANVHGYFLWSVFDNFEWERGFGPRFGLVRVNYESLARTPKQSAYWFGEVIRQNAVSI